MASDDMKKADLMFFYVDWCPQCIATRPMWDYLKAASQKSNVINGYPVTFTEINCSYVNLEHIDSDEHGSPNKLMQKYGVDGFPSILLVTNDGTTEKPTIYEFTNLGTFIDNILTHN